MKYNYYTSQEMIEKLSKLGLENDFFGGQSLSCKNDIHKENQHTYYFLQNKTKISFHSIDFFIKTVKKVEESLNITLFS